jgi:hypothetical protein
MKRLKPAGRGGLCVRLAVIALSAVLTAGAGPRTAVAERTALADRVSIELPGVSEISAYRGVLAIAQRRPNKCGSMRLWSASNGFGGSVAAGCSDAGGYKEIAAVALGANVLVWIFSWGDLDSGADCLKVRRVHHLKPGASLTRPGHACSAEWAGPATVPAFEAVANGGTHGAGGKLLTFLAPALGGVVYSRSAYCNVDCGPTMGSPRVPQHTEATLFVSQAGEETMVAGPKVRVVAAGGSSLAAMRAGESLDLLNFRTRKWRHVLNGKVRAARLDGGALFVLRPNAVLETYDVGSARRTAVQTLTAPTRSPVRFEDVGGGIVVYLAGGEIHIRRSSDQRESTFPLPTNAVEPIHAQIDSVGVYVSYNRAAPAQGGVVTFVPRSTLFR